MSTTKWVTKRSHLQVSKTEVLPVIFRSKKVPRSVTAGEPNQAVPPAFPETEFELSDSLELVKDWLLEHFERIYRVGAMNAKPGALEAPEVLRKGNQRFTVWLEPTAANFALLCPTDQFLKNNDSETRPAIEEDKGSRGDFEAFSSTPQSLYVIAEFNE